MQYLKSVHLCSFFLSMKSTNSHSNECIPHNVHVWQKESKTSSTQIRKTYIKCLTKVSRCQLPPEELRCAMARILWNSTGEMKHTSSKDTPTFGDGDCIQHAEPKIFQKVYIWLEILQLQRPHHMIHIIFMLYVPLCPKEERLSCCKKQPIPGKKYFFTRGGHS